MAEKLLCEEGGCVNSAKGKAQECLNMELEASKAGHFDTALGKLQEGRDLLKEGGLELWLQLSNGLAETYCQAARWQDCVSLCKLTLTSWDHSPHHFELLQTLFYLTQACYMLDLEDQGYAAVEEWSGKLVADTARSKCVLLCTQANKLKCQNKERSAAWLYEKALQWDSSPSYVTICSRLYLASVYSSLDKYEKAEEAFLTTLDLFSVHFPKSYAFALCHNQLAALYKKVKRLQDAEKQYLLAKEFYIAHFPHTEGHTNCLRGLGEVYEKMKRLGDAEEQFLEADQLCSAYLPQSRTHLECLTDLGGLYVRMDRKKEAVAQYLLTLQLYSVYFPQNESYVWCSLHLGLIYDSLDKSGKAIKQFKLAIQLCSTNFP